MGLRIFIFLLVVNDFQNTAETADVAVRVLDSSVEMTHKRHVDRDVAFLIKDIMDTYMESCQATYVAQHTSSSIIDILLRPSSHQLRSGNILDLGEISATQSDDLLEAIKRGDNLSNCRVFLLDLTDHQVPSSTAFRFLQAIQLFLIPNTFLIFLGGRRNLKEVLLADPLRNSPNALYLVTSSGKNDFISSGIKSVPHRTDDIKNDTSDPVSIYARCCYCHNGEAGLRQVAEWTLTQGYAKRNSLFEDQFRNMEGHQFNLVILNWLPFVDFIRDSDETSTTVTPKESVDVKMVDSIAQSLNFTYEMRVPWDNQWGTTTDTGNWTGIIGTLQHHKGDFSFAIRWLWSRRQVVDYSRIYASEPMVLVMSEPKPLPPLKALVRPLEGEVWLAVFLVSVSAGLILWALQRSWARLSRQPGLGFDTSILSTWSILFLEPASKLPKNVSGQMFIGWWWVFCTIITVVYKSSLVAHLSIPSKSKAINSFEELLTQDGWTWGTEPIYGGSWEWLKRSTDPTIMEIFRNIEVEVFNDQMDKVLKGQHVLLTWKYKIQSLAADYTRRYGHAPIYTARTEYLGQGGYGWAFRKNAPFLPAIDMAKQRLIEGGIVNYWLNDRIGKGTAAKDSSKNDDEDSQKKKILADKDVSRRVVLGMLHLQSVFFVLLLGYFTAFLAVVGEIIYHFHINENYEVGLCV